MKKVRHILLALEWYQPKIHRGVARYAREAHWHLNASMCTRNVVPRGWHGNGIICNSPRPQKNESRPIDLSLFPEPKVEIGRHVRNDDQAIAQLAVRHFSERGFRTFAVAGPRFIVDTVRYRTFKELVARIPRTQCLDFLCPTTMGRWENRQSWFDRRLRAAPKPLAVFAIDDDWGAEMLETAIAAGVRVPDEVAILGVRNDELVCEALSIPLSSVENNLEQVGYAAAALLDRHLDGEPLPAEPVLIPPAGVVSRLSTEVLAVQHPQVALAVRYLQGHYREPLDIDSIARTSGMSRRGLYNAFQTHLRCTLGEKLNEIRLHHAERLLLETDFKLGEIAVAGGFGDARNFYNAFRKRWSAAPGDWRRQNRQRLPAAAKTGN